MRNHEGVLSGPVDLSTELNQPFYSPAQVARLAGLHPSTIPNRAVRKMLAPETVSPPRIIEQPRGQVDSSEADREPEWPWPE